MIPSRPAGGHLQHVENNTTGCCIVSGHHQIQGHMTCDVDTGAEGPQ
jgi:hypothetical protein